MTRDTQPLNDDPIAAVVNALTTAHAREIALIKEAEEYRTRQAVEAATQPLKTQIESYKILISYLHSVVSVVNGEILEKDKKIKALKERYDKHLNWGLQAFGLLFIALIIAVFTAYAFYLRVEVLKPPVTAQIYMPVMSAGVPLHQVTQPTLTPAQEDDLAIVRAERQSEDYPLGFTAPAELPLGKTLYYMGSNTLRWRIAHRVAGQRVGQLRWMYEESVRVVVHTGNCNFSSTTAPEQGRAYYIIRAAGIPGGSKALLLTDDPTCAVRNLKELTK